MLLQVQNLAKHYEVDGRTIHAVRGIDLEVDAGDTVGIVGYSGAGKSTLLHLLGGLEHPTSGDVLLRGNALYSRSDQKRLDAYRQRDVGFVFQFHYLLEEFSALENVMIPLRIQRVPAAEAEERARIALAGVGLADRLQHRPAQLSGGEQQRAAIARATVHGPALLLADEPTGNLDAENGRIVTELLVDMCQNKSMAMVVVTHNADVAGAMQRQMEMESGQWRVH